MYRTINVKDFGALGDGALCTDAVNSAIKSLAVEGETVFFPNGICEKILVSNCTISSKTAVFKTGTASKGGFRNVTLSNCVFHDCEMGCIKLPCVDGGIIRNILISDVRANVTLQDKERTPIMITGHYVEKIQLNNLNITFPGGGTKEDAERQIAEDDFRYPEQWFFGVLPAYAMFARHIQG